MQRQINTTKLGAHRDPRLPAGAVRQLEVRVDDRGPTDPAQASFPPGQTQRTCLQGRGHEYKAYVSPDADGLVLIRQLMPVAIVEVVRGHHVGGGAEEVLGAAGRGEIVIVTAVLGHLLSIQHLLGGLKYCQVE